MANERGKCKNCRFWFMEPGKFPSITGGYGKCRASFIDRQGKIQVYNKGTIGKGGCSATDDNDKYLFQEIPY